MKVIIIEDEPLAAETLSEMVQAYDPSIQILALLPGVEESLQWLRTHPFPDLVFSDIHLSDGNCFSIFEQIALPSAVVFTTAYNQYAIQAFQVHSIDYLLKPFTPQAVAKALQKYQSLRQHAAPAPDYSALRQNALEKKPAYKTRFLVKTGEVTRAVPVAEVAYLFAESKAVILTTRHKQQHLVDFTIEELIQQLDPALFFRLNRQFLVHIDAIEGVTPHFNGRYRVSLKPPPAEPVFVSSDRAAEFKKWLDL